MCRPLRITYTTAGVGLWWQMVSLSPSLWGLYFKLAPVWFRGLHLREIQVVYSDDSGRQSKVRQEGTLEQVTSSTVHCKSQLELEYKPTPIA